MSKHVNLDNKNEFNTFFIKETELQIFINIVEHF